jgi:hypothetical protein
MRILLIKDKEMKPIANIPAQTLIAKIEDILMEINKYSKVKGV